MYERGRPPGGNVLIRPLDEKWKKITSLPLALRQHARFETRLVYRHCARSRPTYLCGPGELKAEQGELSTAAINELSKRHQSTLNSCKLSEALQRHLETKYRTTAVSSIKKCQYYCHAGYLRQDFEPILRSQRTRIPSRLSATV